jgi:hypothetical protein
MNDKFRFSDDVIAQVAKLVQVAILSGTDIVDHLRQVRLKMVEDSMYLHDDYIAQFEGNLESMLQELKDGGIKTE